MSVKKVAPTLQLNLSEVCLLVIATTAMMWLLERMAGVLIPFIFAMFLYYMMLPVMRWTQKKWHLSHAASAAIAMAAYLLLYLIFIWLIASNVRSAIESADQYRERLIVFFDQISSSFSKIGLSFSREDLQNHLKNNQLFAWFSGLSGGIAGILGNVALVLIFLLFLLLSPIQYSHDILQKIETQLVRYIIIKTLISFSVGVLVTVMLAVLGVDMASLFGLLTFLLNFIPNIGSIIAVILPLPVVLLQYGWGTVTLLTLVLPATMHFVVGNIVEPKVLGGTLDLHPITVLFALVYWGIVWGITGMFLAIPITAVLKIVFDHFTPTRPLAHLMSGRIF